MLSFAAHSSFGLVTPQHAASHLLRSARVRTLVSMSGDQLLYLERLDQHARRKQGLLGSKVEERLVLELNEARPADWRRVATALSPNMKEKRVVRLQDVLRRRRSRLHLVRHPFSS